MRFPRLLLLLPITLLSVARLHAQLQWEQPTQEFLRVPEDKEIFAHYNFHNAGTKPVTIKYLRPSCGCTTVHLDKKTYAPGESGHVDLHFGFGDRKGLYHKTVTVMTDDQAALPDVLHLLITIQEAVTITPALVFWKRGEAAAAKSVQVTAQPSQQVHIKSVTSSNPRLIAKLETSKPGEQYAISVQPADTTQKETGEISVQTDYPPDAPHLYTIHARIK